MRSTAFIACPSSQSGIGVLSFDVMKTDRHKTQRRLSSAGRGAPVALTEDPTGARFKAMRSKPRFRRNNAGKVQLVSCHSDFFQKRALRRAHRRAFLLWGPELQLDERVQLAGAIE